MSELELERELAEAQEAAEEARADRDAAIRSLREHAQDVAKAEQAAAIVVRIANEKVAAAEKDIEWLLVTASDVIARANRGASLINEPYLGRLNDAMETISRERGIGHRRVLRTEGAAEMVEECLAARSPSRTERGEG